MAAEQAPVIDITAELIGERRQEWRDGFDAGMKQGTSRVLQSDALGQIVAELKMLRTFVECMTEVAHQREGLIAELAHQAEYWHWTAARLGDPEARGELA